MISWTIGQKSRWESALLGCIGKLSFQGQWLHGQMHGIGCFRFFDGDTLEVYLCAKEKDTDL